ncbi:hypothetical protein DFJ74DRAFT_724872 [Hyaloraphidium curvatum]|nr:hypothetical protein DFJ74DRAFT_724872 [Hyaloraphidium curvatum]
MLPATNELLAEEWLALFPSASTRVSPLDDGAPPDPTALLRELRAYPLLHFSVRLQLGAGPWAAAIVLRLFILATVGIPLLVGGTLTFNDGTFGTRQLAAGVGVGVVALLFNPLFLLLSAGSSVRSTFLVGKRMAAANDLSGHATANVARWAQLVRTRPDAPLVAHVPGDPLCPCPDPSCAGSLPVSAGRWRAFESAARIVIQAGTYAFAYFYTPLVTFGPRLWRTWWALLGAAGILAGINGYVVSVLARFNTNVGLLGLSLRLQRRAMVLELRDLLGRVQRCQVEALGAADGPRAPSDTESSLAVAASKDEHKDGATAPPRPDSPDLFSQLHTQLASSWAHRVPFLASGLNGLLSIGGMSVAVIVANIAAGMCVPAYALLNAAVILQLSGADLVNICVSNAQIDEIVALYRDAVRRIRELRVRADRLGGGVPAVRRHAEELEGLDALLRSYEEVAGLRGKFAGAIMDWGVLRTVVVTMLTIVVGIWSISRGSGIVVTMDNVCPGTA